MRSIYYNRIIKLHTLNFGEGKECYVEVSSVLLHIKDYYTYTRIGVNKYA